MEYTIISREEALSQGLKLYFTGLPCKRGHLSTKSVDSYYCTECAKENAKKWQDKNPEKLRENLKKFRDSEKGQRSARNYRLKREFNITIEKYEELLTSQKNVCYICKNACTIHDNLCVDHCHKTGIVRGLLCVRCNTTLGKVEESTDILKSMISYLELHAQD